MIFKVQLLHYRVVLRYREIRSRVGSWAHRRIAHTVTNSMLGARAEDQIDYATSVPATWPSGAAIAVYACAGFVVVEIGDELVEIEPDEAYNLATLIAEAANEID